MRMRLLMPIRIPMRLPEDFAPGFRDMESELGLVSVVAPLLESPLPFCIITGDGLGRKQKEHPLASICGIRKQENRPPVSC